MLKALVVVLLITIGFAQTSRPLGLSYPVRSTLNEQSYDFFSIDIPLGTAPSQVLLVTVDSTQAYSQPEISISADSQFPTLDDNEQLCFLESLNTCSRTNLVAGQVLYVSVYCQSVCTYTINAQIMEVQRVILGHQYQADFKSMSSGILSFEAQGFDQVIILAEYLNFYDMGRYEMVLSKGKIPSDGHYDIESQQLGAFRKAIKLESQDLQTNQKYYILLSGQSSVKLKLSLKGQNVDSLMVPLNGSAFDIVTSETSYVMSYPLTQSTYSSALSVRLREVSGYGQIIVKYCNQTSFTFQDMNGQNGELFITPEQRKLCIYKTGNLAVENLHILLQPYSQKMGVILSVSQGSAYNLEVFFNEQEYGVLDPNTNRQYKLIVHETSKVNVSLTINIYEGDPNFKVNRCGAFGCVPVVPSTTPMDEKFTFEHEPQICRQRCYYELKVTASDRSARFSFVFKLVGYHIMLIQGKPDVGLVELNQYVFYTITQQNTSNITSINIHTEEISGSIAFLTSRQHVQPAFSDIFKKDSEVRNIWNGSWTYYEDLSKPIYIGVLGQSQGIYRISYHAGRDENIPSRYLLLSDQKINEFAITNSDALLLKYSPHSTPYSISISPMTSCISYGLTLPLPMECLPPVPNPITTQLFLNISQLPVGSIVRISISSGHFKLRHDHPLIIQCNDACQDSIIVNITDKTQRVIHTGYGKLVNLKTSEEVQTGILQVQCEKQISCEVELMAKMQYGGQMILSLESSQTQQLGARITTLTLSSLPKRLYYKLPKFTSSVISIDSRGAVLMIAPRVQLLNSSYSNLLQLQFSDDYDSSTDPFKRNSIIEVSEHQQQQMGCFETSGYCVLTLQVALNSQYFYSQDFLTNGVVYASVSSGITEVAEGVQYRRRGHHEIQYYQYFSIQQQNITVLLTPINNCKPIILFLDRLDEFPTMSHYTQKTQLTLTLVNKSSIIIGVRTEEACLYDLMLLTNKVNMIYLEQGIPKKIDIPEKASTHFVFYAHFAEQFSVQSTTQNVSILINKLPYGANPEDFIPTSTQHDYFQQQAPLLIQASQTSNYVISICNLHPYRISSNVMVRYPHHTATLLHAILYKMSIANETNSYRYYSANSFYIYLTSFGGNFSLNVASDSEGTKTHIDDWKSSNSPLLVTVRQGAIDLEEFTISVQGSGKYTIQIIEYGTEGRPELLRGMPFQDSFRGSHLNCYKVAGKAGDTQPFQLSFALSLKFVQELRGKYQNQPFDIKSYLPEFSYTFSSYFSQDNQPQLVKQISSDYGMSYTVEQQYGMYTFCFSQNSDLKAINDQNYFVVASANELEFLLPTLSYYQNQTEANFQLVVEDDLIAVTELIDCKGSSQLTATSNYSKLKSGLTSEILNYVKNGAYYAGKINLDRGYLYMNIKTLSPESAYLLTTYIYPPKQTVSLLSWQISSSKLRWYVQNKWLYVVAASPKPQLVQNISYGNLQFHLDISSNEDNVTSYSRCGINSTDSPIINQVEELSINDLKQNITWKIQIGQLPDSFSIAAKALIPEQQFGVKRTVPYFYDNVVNLIKKEIAPESTQSSSFWGIAVFIILVVVVTVVTISISLCKYKQSGLFKPKQTIAFELSPLNTKNSSSRPEQQQRDTQESAPQYGQFVDESKL